MNILKTLSILAITLVGFQAQAQTTATPAAAQAVQTAPANGLAEAATSAKVRINQASAQEIAAALNGVGMVKAQSIIEFRNTNGPFMSGEELTQVKGVGPATVEKNISLISFE